MTKKESLIKNIVKIEWGMFQSISSNGGKASYQNYYRNFRILRYSQVASWSELTLESYLNDLKKAGKSSRNLQTEKYARMMQFTYLSEYSRIKYLFPQIDNEVYELVEKIVAILLEWDEDLNKRSPNIMRIGRPVCRLEDTLALTPFETSLRAELFTYSQKTLKFYLADILQYKSANVNGSEIMFAYIIKFYAYDSLEEVNEKLK